MPIATASGTTGVDPSRLDLRVLAHYFGDRVGLPQFTRRRELRSPDRRGADICGITNTRSACRMPSSSGAHRLERAFPFLAHSRRSADADRRLRRACAARHAGSSSRAGEACRREALDNLELRGMSRFPKRTAVRKTRPDGDPVNGLRRPSPSASRRNGGPNPTSGDTSN